MLKEFKQTQKKESPPNKNQHEVPQKNSNFQEVLQREPEIKSNHSNKIYKEFKESQKKEEELEKEINEEKINNLMEKVKSLEREIPKEETRKINSNNKYTTNFVCDYKLEGRKYELIKLSDKILKNDFVKNGFHVINLRMEKDPINGKVNGKFTIRVRLNDVIEQEFEDYVSYRDMRVLSKRIF